MNDDEPTGDVPLHRETTKDETSAARSTWSVILIDGDSGRLLAVEPLSVFEVSLPRAGDYLQRWLRHNSREVRLVRQVLWDMDRRRVMLSLAPPESD